jgi:1-pyrroline-5-carboxylate dehydrogenase
MYGDIFFKIAAEMRKPEIQDYFTKLIQRVMPKNTAQIVG